MSQSQKDFSKYVNDCEPGLMAYSIGFDAGLGLEFGLNMGKRVHTPIGVREAVYPHKAMYLCKAVYLNKAVYGCRPLYLSKAVYLYLTLYLCKPLYLNKAPSGSREKPAALYDTVRL